MSTKMYRTAQFALNEILTKPDLPDKEFETNVKGIAECHKQIFGLNKPYLDFHNKKHLLTREQIIGHLAEFVNQLSKT